METRRWTTEQQQSIEARGGTLLVSAAAGSGKTAVLVERILTRLLGTEDTPPVDVDRLLVVTFTRAAAAEMKQRLSERLTQIAATAEPDQRARIRRQLLRLPFAQISTIDGFCAWLIRDHAALLGISPDFKVMDEASPKMLWKAALSEELERRYAAHDEAFVRLADTLCDGKDDRVLIDAVDALNTFLQSLPFPEEWMARQQAAIDTDVPLEQAPWFEAQRKAAFRYAQSAMEKADTMADLLSRSPEIATLYEKVPDADRAVIQTYLDVLQTPDLSWRELTEALAAVKYMNLPRYPADLPKPPSMVRFRKLRNDLKDDISKVSEILSISPERYDEDRRRTTPLLAALFDLVTAADEAFWQKKLDARSLDFHDLARLALKLLVRREGGVSRPTDIADTLHAQFEEILVDEYQDVNELQNALFTALSRNETNLFFVGDVKQSIYAFRKARPELFLDRLTQFAPYSDETYPASILLKENFRSVPQVTDAVNFICSQLFSREVGGLVYGADEALVPHRDPAVDHTCDTTLMVLDTEKMLGGDADDDDEENTAGAQDANEAEATAIAREIQSMIDGGMAIPLKDGTSRPAEYGDFCILLRSFKHHAPTYESVLGRLGIPAYAEGTGDFFDASEIRLMMSLLQCIDNPLRDVAMLAVMLSPLYGFTPDDLARIRMRDPKRRLYSALKKIALTNGELPARCGAFLRELDGYRLLAATVPVDQLIRQLFETTDVLHLMAVRPDGAQRVANLHLFYEKAHSFEENGFRGLSAFLRHCQRMKEHATVETAAVGDLRNTVRILSMHKSKGLEFPVVFVAGLAVGFNKKNATGPLLLHPDAGVGLRIIDPDTLVRRDTVFYAHVKRQIQLDEKAEHLRLLYVAMTRAREKLYLVTRLKDPQKTLGEVAADMRRKTVELPPAMILKGQSFGDWVLRAAFRHPDAAPLREIAGVPDDYPLLPASYPWRVKVLDAAAVTQQPVESPDEAPKPDETLLQTLTERFTYAYPYHALGQVPSKVAASDLAHRDHSRAFVAVARPSFANAAHLTAAQRGTALHLFMQYADWSAAAVDPGRERDRLVAEGFLTREQADAVELPRLQTFFESDLYRRIAKATHLWREIPFTIEAPLTELTPDAPVADLPPDSREEALLIQGIADCVFEEDGGLVIVDYKTDRVTGGDALIVRYHRQLQVYALALSKALDRPVNECLLYSFALGDTFGVPLPE